MNASGEYQSCAVCGRTILRGERASPYLDSERREAGVCALCKPRAEAMGWVPAALAETVAQPAGQRRRLALASGLRERLSRAAAAARPRDRDVQPEGEAGGEEAPAYAEPEAAEPQPAPAPPTPIEVFNASEEARKVAGLTKSLGEPRVTVRDDVVTVAWELSWYQWRVQGSRVKEIARGNEISEVPGPDRAWNAAAAPDGTLSLA